jgi:V8-like Glu-specific endopeptidase
METLALAGRVNKSLEFIAINTGTCPLSFSNAPSFKYPHILTTSSVQYHADIMVRINAFAAGLSALYAVQANPVPVQDPGAGGLVYDPEVKKFFGPDSIIPETIIVDDKSGEFRSSSVEHPFTTPFIPSGIHAPKLSKRWFSGPDDRVLQEDTTYPYSAVGKLLRGDGSSCSAAMVGPRHILTARHCGAATNLSFLFAPDFDNVPRFGITPIVAKLYAEFGGDGPCETNKDFAIMILQDRFGDEVGWFGTQWPDPAKFGKPIFEHMGYPSDLYNGFRPVHQANTTINPATSLECDISGPIYSDNDNWGGQSGGPLWENEHTDGPYIWGTLAIGVMYNNDEHHIDNFSGWASGNLMVDTLIKALKEYP